MCRESPKSSYNLKEASTTGSALSSKPVIVGRKLDFSLSDLVAGTRMEQSLYSCRPPAPRGSPPKDLVETLLVACACCPEDKGRKRMSSAWLHRRGSGSRDPGCA